MTKQEFLAFSLPYGLHGKIKNTICELTRMGAYTINTKPSVHSHTYCLIEDFIPILRPLSDLTKEIEHKGDKFVPIVKLMQIAYESQDRCITSKSVYVEDNMHTVKVNVFEFAFDIDDNSFISILNNSLSAVPNQLDLFQQLVKWHFDLFGGIESGEAIDVNTLDINPYA